jgi:hypothetical protein
MAQKVLVEMVDDLDGVVGDDVTTVGFALDGRSYEIDLSSRNADNLRDGLAEFIAAGRRQRGGRATRGGGDPRPSATLDPAARERAHAIREWAREAGREVSGRGRIPAVVVEAYEAAQRAPQPQAEKPVEKKVEKEADKSSANSSPELPTEPLRRGAEQSTKEPAVSGEVGRPAFSG